MKTKLIMIMLALFSVGWGQENGILGNAKSVSDPLQNNITDSLTTEEDELIDKIKKIINEQSDATEIGYFHIRDYAIVFPQYFPVHCKSPKKSDSLKD